MNIYSFLILMSILLQFPISAIREIKVLKRLHHENVVSLKEVVISQGISSLACHVLLCKSVSAVLMYSIFVYDGLTHTSEKFGFSQRELMN